MSTTAFSFTLTPQTGAALSAPGMSLNRVAAVGFQLALGSVGGPPASAWQTAAAVVNANGSVMVSASVTAPDGVYWVWIGPLTPIPGVTAIPVASLIVGTGGVLVVVDNGDGSWTASGSGVVDNGDGSWTVGASGAVDNGNGSFTLVS